MTPINPQAFFEHVRNEIFNGSMSQSQVDGMNSLLEVWPDETDLRFVAYALATAFWETAQTMQPIEEYGKGRGRGYGAPAGPWHQVYDGRGDVQLTWLDNYQHANELLHADGTLKPNESLVENPALALRPDIAAAIMVRGMSGGWFTKYRLTDFFTPTRTDWVGARRIINGQDHASQIASFAVKFWHALTAEGTIS